MHRRSVFLSLSVLLAGAAPVASASAGTIAQAAPRPDAGVYSHGQEILVTATREAIPIGAVTSSVTALDKADIDRAQDITIAGLLDRTPGVSLIRNGGFGTTTSVLIRGADSDQTVVVIDGVKMNDPSMTGGGYNFANLLVGDAARIEVLRGPQSILWGSRAIGGVINIVTAMPEKSFEGSVDIEAGSRDTVSTRAAIGGRSGPVAWRFGGQVFSTEGVSAIAPEFGGKEPDGYRNRNLSGRVEVTLADNVTLDLRGYYSSGNTDIDGFAGDSSEFSTDEQFIGYAGLNVDLMNERFRNRIAFGYTSNSRENLNPDLERPQTFDANGRNRRIEYTGNFAITDKASLLFGAEYEKATFRTLSPAGSLAIPVPDPTTGSSATTSFYGQLRLEPIAGLHLTGGLRHDHHDRYGNKTLFSAGAAWNLPTGTTLKGSYSEGFKAPALYQMFSEYGNIDLRPEDAKAWEAGVEQALFDDRLQLGATWFARKTTDLIIFNSCLPGNADPSCLTPGTGVARFGYYKNIARSEAHGIEATAALHVGALLLDGNYTWTHVTDRSPGADTFGNQAPRRPRHSANGSVSYAWPFGLTTGAAIRWSGKTFDDDANLQPLASYTVVDLRAEMKLSPEVSLFARAENLFDKHYMTAYRYGSLGRSIYAGIRGRF